MFLQRVHVVTLNFSMLQLCVSLDSNLKKKIWLGLGRKTIS